MATDEASTLIVIPERPDTRPTPPMLAGERENLLAWLEYYRETVLYQAVGLTAAQLCARPVAGSGLCLAGLIRHMADVERGWLGYVLLGQGEPHLLSTSPECGQGEMESDCAASVVAAIHTYRAAVSAMRDNVALWPDLDVPVTNPYRAQPVNLRWILTHVIEEYARHMGHAEVIRRMLELPTAR